MLAFDSAVQLGDAGQQASILNSVAWANTRPGQDVQSALAYAERALALARLAGDVRQEGRAWQHIAHARTILRDLPAALDAVRAAAERFELAGDADAYCQAVLGRGDIAMHLGDVVEALASFQRALGMVEDPASGMTASIAASTLPFALGQTARALGQAGRGAEGIPLALRAVDLSGRMQLFIAQARILRILAEDLYGDDHAAEAHESLLRAAEIYESIGHHDDASRCREGAAAKDPGSGS
jgi:tetratricopeptide (TPR) repeat protein